MGVEERKLESKRVESLKKAAMTLAEIGGIERHRR